MMYQVSSHPVHRQAVHLHQDTLTHGSHPLVCDQVSPCSIKVCLCAIRVYVCVRSGFGIVCVQASRPCTIRLQNRQSTLQGMAKSMHRFLVRDPSCATTIKRGTNAVGEGSVLLLISNPNDERRRTQTQ